MVNKILIIDDNATIRSYFQGVISSNFDSEVTSVISGFEALKITNESKFDIILIDICMPGIDGLETARRIRKQKPNKETTIIFITAYDPKKLDMDKALEAGGIDYLIKPVSPSFLIQTIKLYLRFITREEELNRKLRDEIIEKNNLQNEINLAKENFENIVGKSDAGIFIIDNEEILRFINKSGEKIFMRKADELIGEPFGMMFGYETKTELEIIRKNGEVGYGEVSITHTQWKNNPATLIMINDITEHVKLQNNLKIATIKAQESDRLKSAFLANMSHEIRTPMNAILGFSQLLYDETISHSERIEYLEIINSRGADLMGIITDIIDISKLEAGIVNINSKECSVNKLIDDIINTFKQNTKVVDGNIKLQYSKALNDNECIFLTDDIRVRQILINLVNNAIKFTNEGQIKIGYTIEEYNKKKYLQFYVEDTGIGLSERDKEIVFERFMQANDSNIMQHDGTGLGLSISKAFVNLLGGEIWVDSKPNEGSIFYFTILFEQILKKEKQIEVKADKTSEIKKLKKGNTILIVDDVISNTHLLKLMLKKKADTITAGSGEEAIEICRNNSSIDLVLMDIKMPGLNGYQALKKIRSFRKDLPVIAQTAYALGGDR